MLSGLEEQMVSLELARELKELGIIQGKSAFVWEYVDQYTFGIYFRPYAVVPFEGHIKLFDAFNVCELFELLPAHIDLKDKIEEPYNNFWLVLEKRNAENIQYILSYQCDTISGQDVILNRITMPHSYRVHDEKLANACAKLLIKLIKDGIVKI